jgi:hypothetical protein
MPLKVAVAILLTLWLPPASPAAAQEFRAAAIPHIGLSGRHTPRGWEPGSYAGSISIEGTVATDLWISIEPAARLLLAACDDASGCVLVATSLGAGVVWRPAGWVPGARIGIAKPFQGRKAWMPYAGLEAQLAPSSSASLWAGLRYQPLFHEAQFDGGRFAMTREDFLVGSVGVRIGGRPRR